MNKIKIFVTFLLMFFIQTRCSAQMIDVVFNIDNNYPIYTLLAINSILKNNASNSDYTFYIVNDGISKFNKSIMKKFVKSNKQKIVFINFDIKNYSKDKVQYADVFHITNIGMARCFLDDILPENVHKVLYLDGDILVTDDIAKLYNTDLNDKFIGMAPDLSSAVSDEIQLTRGIQDYYNSGVILMDLDKLRSNNTTKKMISFLEKKWSRAYIYKDQDLINFVLKNHIMPLEQKWNTQVTTGYAIDTNNKGILHYISSVKPWTFGDLRLEHSRNYIWSPIYSSRNCNLDAYAKYYKAWKSSPLVCYLYLCRLNVLLLQYKNMKYAKILKLKQYLYNLTFYDYPPVVLIR